MLFRYWESFVGAALLQKLLWFPHRTQFSNSPHYDFFPYKNVLYIYFFNLSVDLSLDRVILRQASRHYAFAACFAGIYAATQWRCATRFGVLPNNTTNCFINIGNNRLVGKFHNLQRNSFSQYEAVEIIHQIIDLQCMIVGNIGTYSVRT